MSYHHFIENTPYSMMFGRKPHREIQDLIDFPTNPEDPCEERKYYNRIMEKIEKQKTKYSLNRTKVIKYQILYLSMWLSSEHHRVWGVFN